MQRYPTHKCRGIMVADALIGLFIAGSLLTVLAVSSGYNLRASRAAESSHRLITQAELTLLALQAGRQADVPPGELIQIRITPLQGDDANDAWVWVRVEATDQTRQASLVGRVPRASLHNENGGQP